MKYETKIIVFSLFLFGLLFMYNNPIREGLESQYKCPNILVQKGLQLYLYNSKVAKIPGVNPVKFNNLEEYTEFMEWQRNEGIKCPVLFMQKTLDTQGGESYKTRDFDDSHIPSNLSSELDDSSDDNPMNPNWKGASYTQSLIDAGYYKGNEINDVYIP